MFDTGYQMLYKRAKTGKIQEWSAWIEIHDIKGVDVPCIMRKSGQQNGKQNTKSKYIKSGKNIGKSNEQSPLDQARFQLANMIKGKLEDNMVERLEDVDHDPQYLYPALAVGHNAKKTEKLLKKRGYLYVQPKLNGARCWKVNHLELTHNHSATPENALISRTLKEFGTLAHIDNELKDLDKLKITPDGEIFNPEFDFQTIISLLKKQYAVGENEDYPDLCTEDLQYHIYDIAADVFVYEARKGFLDRFFAEYKGSILQPVATHKVTTMAEIDQWNEHYILLGYEGLIIRDPESKYAFNDRNESLIKYKKFYDAEFPIVDFSYEEWDDVLTGKIRKLVLWICETSSGKRFTSRPKGSFLVRERLYKEADKHIGDLLTVRYQELSQDGTPIMNVGLGGVELIEAEAIRDYE